MVDGKTKSESNICSRIFLTRNLGIFFKKRCSDILNNLILPKDIFIKNLITNDKQNYIFSYLISEFWIEYILYGFLILFSTILKYGQPLALEFILNILSNYNLNDRNDLIKYMVILVMCNFLSSLIQAFYDYKMGVLKIKARSIYMVKIFDIISHRKFLESSDSGKICNFINNDLTNVEGFAQSFHDLICIILQFTICFFLLYRQIKLFFLLGIVYCIALFPVNFLIGRKVNRYYKNILSISDQRIKNLKEILAGIIVIKINNWVEPFKKLYLAVRNNELKNLSGEKYLDAFCVVFWASSPSIITLISLSLYFHFYNELSLAKALTSMSIFNLLNFPINVLSCTIIGIIKAIISGKRLSKFLADDQIFISPVYENIISSDSNDTLISFKDVSFCYRSTNCHEKILENLNLSIKNNSFIGIFGPVGSGKSSFLKSIIGDLHLCCGSILKNNYKISYIPQKPNLFNGTIRDNILRGSTFNISRYTDVINACCLNKDIDSFPQKDLKNVGNRGERLSGGQIIRIFLAASIYQDSDIYLFDDIFSALDIKVANEIFQKCLNEFLASKARIFCCSNSYFINKFEEKYFIKDKKLQEKCDIENINIEENTTEELICEKFRHRESIESEIDILYEDENTENKENSYNLNFFRHVKFGIYRKYFKFTPKYSLLILFFSILIYTFFLCTTDWWITYWLNTDTKNQTNIFLFTDNLSKSNQFIIIYSSLNVAVLILVIIRSFLFAYAFLNACKNIHELMISSLFNAKFNYYEISNTGFLINKFLTDTFGVDEHIPFKINILLAYVFKFLGTTATICLASPFFLIIIPMFIPFMLYIEHIYRRTSNFVKRINVKSMDPIYNCISETFENSYVVRVCKLSEWLRCNFEKFVEKFIESSYAMLYVSSTLNFVIALICFILQSFLMITSIIMLNYFIAYSDLIGLGITYSLGLGSILFNLLTNFVETEKMMIHVENIFNYLNDISNYQNVKSLEKIESIENWDINFHDVHLKYNDSCEIFPSGLNLKIPLGTKVGICGRTGSGKSSIIKLLFQIESPYSGQIKLNDIDIKNISKYYLYSNMFLITQKPVIFSQNLRFNIDPHNKVSYLDIIECLNKTGFSENAPEMKLDTLLDDSQSLSGGLKQLLVASRALINKPKILCMDEPTADLDIESEKKLMDIIYREFNDSTIIHVSHKLRNLITCDLIILLKNGIIYEIVSPANLMKKNSEFNNLMNLQD